MSSGKTGLPAFAEEASFQLACAEVGLGRPEELPDFAMSVVDAGFATDELIALAVASPHAHPQDLRNLACRAYLSLGWTAPLAGEEFIVIARGYCRRILDGRLEPFAGLSCMRNLWRLSGYDRLFNDWMCLSESVYLVEDGYPGVEPFHLLAEEAIPATIRKLAASLLHRTD